METPGTEANLFSETRNPTFIFYYYSKGIGLGQDSSVVCEAYLAGLLPNYRLGQTRRGEGDPYTSSLALAVNSGAGMVVMGKMTVKVVPRPN